jgi:glutaminase
LADLEKDEMNPADWEKVLSDSLQVGLGFVHLSKTAVYIPELAKENGNRLGIALARHDETEYSVGEVADPFTLQSIVIVVNLTAALHLLGFSKVFERVGMEPTGDPFNSLVKLETAQTSKPLNPMINAGAIAICALLDEHLGREAFDVLFCLIRSLSSTEPVGFNNDLYESEAETGNRNRALAYFLKDL